MQPNIVTIKFDPLKDHSQRQVHQQLGAFSNWMSRPKDADEIRKDKRRSVPVDALPMVF